MVVSPRGDVGHRDAHRTAENLFETQSVVQIREVRRLESAEPGQTACMHPCLLLTPTGRDEGQK